MKKLLSVLMKHIDRRTALFVIAVMVSSVLCVQFFSQKEVYYRNGALHEVTWRYNSTVAQLEDGLYVSVFDKITRVQTVRIYSQSKGGAVRTSIINDWQKRITVLGEDGNILYEKTLAE